jgi:mannose-6-phosphate isomerase-like protein (cupin superfamily)
MSAEPDPPPYAVTSLDAVQEVRILGGSLRWKPVRRALGVRGFGINAYAADAGQEVVESHDESGLGASGHQELYVVVRGHARFTVDGDEHDAPAGALVFVAPAVRRAARAEADGTLVLAIGGAPGQPYRVAAWEDFFLALSHDEAGDHDAAVATMAAAGPEHDGDAAYHYNFACLLARAGRPAEATAQLGRALRAAPDTVARWAEGDTDLDALRERPDWPLG